ncbi:MAG: hypothetical protein KJS97_14250 [Alphaproteobacteria bacterium]|nr:hypothetical protein [Alphaproteobacteria bacterium]
MPPVDPTRKPRKAWSGASNADKAADAAPGDREDGEDLDERQDKLLDQAVEETFPASDPISPKRIT